MPTFRKDFDIREDAILFRSLTNPAKPPPVAGAKPGGEAAFRQDKTASEPGVLRSGATEGVPARGAAYADLDTSRAFGGSDHRIQNWPTGNWSSLN